MTCEQCKDTGYIISDNSPSFCGRCREGAKKQVESIFDEIHAIDAKKKNLYQRVEYLRRKWHV